MLTLDFKFVDETLSEQEKNQIMPEQKSAWASGFDLASSSKEVLTLNPGDRLLVPTGIAIALPQGYEGQVRSRSGLSIKHGVIVLNAPGTIDADYRGEIKVILANLSRESFSIQFGMRVAQLVIAEVSQPVLRETKILPDSTRGDAGFGSTGLAN